MSKPRILVVEDEGIIAEDIQMSLQELGYEVVGVVNSGEDAVRVAENEHPDLVLMDIMLQGEVGGTEAAAQIRKSLSIPIIYLTAYSDEKILDKAKIAEPFGYMIKPFQDRELHSNIEMALFKDRLEKELSQSRERFSVTLSSIGDAVIATDREGAITFLNPRASDLTGWSENEAISVPLSRVFRTIDPRNGNRVDDFVNKTLERGEPASIESDHIALVDKDGRKCDIEANASPIRTDDGDVIGVVVVFRDVSERKRFQERLKLLSLAMEQTSEGIAVTDLDGNLIFLNQAFADLHGYTVEELEGANLKVFHTEEQLASVEAANRKLRRDGEFSGEIGHVTKDGREFPGLMHNSLLRNAEGEAVAMIGTLRDITELKEAEERLKRSKDELESYSMSLEGKVDERTRDLENSRKELKRYSESLEKTNEALKMIIHGIEEQKKEVEKKITHNLNLTVKPIIDQMKSHELPETMRFLIKSLEFNLTNMFSSFGENMIKEGHLLTPKEIRICEMIRSGLSSKQMAKVMGISPQTVLVHRKNIRKKLGLAKSKQNLASFLKANL